MEWRGGVRREREKRKNFECFFQNSRKQTSFHSAELAKMLMVGERGGGHGSFLHFHQVTSEFNSGLSVSLFSFLSSAIFLTLSVEFHVLEAD